MDLENQQTRKNLEANKGIDVEKLYKQGLGYFIKGYRQRNLNYIDSDILIQELTATMLYDLTKKEQITRALAVRDLEHITEIDLLVYG